MSKEKSVTEKKSFHAISLSGLLEKSIEDAAPDLYVNHAQFHISGNEVFIDLFYISPNIKKEGEVIATFKQRVILPQTLAKGFATALANAVALYEANTNTIIPNKRSPQPEDKITIWSSDEPGDAV